MHSGRKRAPTEAEADRRAGSNERAEVAQGRGSSERTRSDMGAKTRLAQIPRFSCQLGKRQIRGCQKTPRPDPPIFGPARKTPNQGVPKNGLPRSPDFRASSENAKSGGAKKRLAQIPRFSGQLGKRQIKGCQKRLAQIPRFSGQLGKTGFCPDPPDLGRSGNEQNRGDLGKPAYSIAGNEKTSQINKCPDPAKKGRPDPPISAPSRKTRFAQIGRFFDLPRKVLYFQGLPRSPRSRSVPKRGFPPKGQKS